MTLFINLRASANGGIAAADASAWDDGDLALTTLEFSQRVAGRDVLIVTHGFNVDQQEGIETLTLWSERCLLPDTTLCVGVLWPGDSKFLPVVDYVFEGSEAIRSGKKLAEYLNKFAITAQSISFASHSLGARTILEAIRNLTMKPRRAMLMAAAIENDCFAKEYADSAQKVEEIYVLASMSDDVLKWAFPAGNLVGEIIMHGHPYDRSALGRDGPVLPLPGNVKVRTWQIPQAWDFGHSDYLPDGVIANAFPVPVDAPGPTSIVPVDVHNAANKGWKPAWSASVVATQDR